MSKGNGRSQDQHYMVALAKGELGTSVQGYLSRTYGIEINIEDRPVDFKQSIGKVTFWPTKSEDVPRCVGGFYDDGVHISPGAHFGITGLDFVTTYKLEGHGRLKVLRDLDFGEGDILLFSLYDIERIKSGERTPRVVTEHRYRPLLKKGAAAKFLREKFGNFDVMGVGGSVEGYVANGSADIGFDFSTYMRKENGEAETTTIARNGLRVMANAMATGAVIVSRDSVKYTSDLFDETMRAAGGCEVERTAPAMVTPRRKIYHLDGVRARLRAERASTSRQDSAAVR